LAIQSLTRDELLAVLGAARAHRERDWLMILVAFWHGLRSSEVTLLQADAIRDGFITVQRLKGSLRTVQPLFEHAEPLLNERQALLEFARFLLGNQRLFPIGRKHFWTLFRRYARAAGLPAHKQHPHVLKHTIATQMIGSAGIENTRQHLGHKSMSSTGVYTKVTDEQASAAAGRALGAKPL
jgi:integrase/recombinase XerD